MTAHIAKADGTQLDRRNQPEFRSFGATKLGQPEFTWGAGANLVAEGTARTAYLAALRALDANEKDVKLLLAFARS